MTRKTIFESATLSIATVIATSYLGLHIIPYTIEQCARYIFRYCDQQDAAYSPMGEIGAGWLMNHIDASGTFSTPESCRKKVGNIHYD